MNVNGIQPPFGPQPVEPTGQVNAGRNIQELQNSADVVEISTAAQLAAKIAELPDVRMDLIERVKGEIAAGTYETPERLEITVSRLMEELFG